MPSEYPLRISEELSEGLATIWSQRVLDHIRSTVSMLPKNPELGSPQVRPSLARHYGSNLRKLNMSTFVIVYRFDGEIVDVLALVYGPSIT